MNFNKLKLPDISSVKIIPFSSRIVSELDHLSASNKQDALCLLESFVLIAKNIANHIENDKQDLKDDQFHIVIETARLLEATLSSQLPKDMELVFSHPLTAMVWLGLESANVPDDKTEIRKELEKYLSPGHVPASGLIEAIKVISFINNNDDICLNKALGICKQLQKNEIALALFEEQVVKALQMPLYNAAKCGKIALIGLMFYLIERLSLHIAEKHYDAKFTTVRGNIVKKANNYHINDISAPCDWFYSDLCYQKTIDFNQIKTAIPNQEFCTPNLSPMVCERLASLKDRLNYQTLFRGKHGALSARKFITALDDISDGLIPYGAISKYITNNLKTWHKETVSLGIDEDISCQKILNKGVELSLLFEQQANKNKEKINGFI